MEIEMREDVYIFGLKQFLFNYCWSYPLTTWAVCSSMQRETVAWQREINWKERRNEAVAAYFEVLCICVDNLRKNMKHLNLEADVRVWIPNFVCY